MQSLWEQLHNFFLLFNKMLNFHTSSFLKKEQANAQPSCYTGLKAIWPKIFLLPSLSPWTQLAPTRRKGIIGLMQAASSFFFFNPNTWEKKSANRKFPDSYIFQIYETSYQRSKQLLHKNRGEKIQAQ